MSPAAHEGPLAVLHQALGPPVQKGCELVGADSEEAVRMLREVEHLCYEDRLRVEFNQAEEVSWKTL